MSKKEIVLMIFFFVELVEDFICLRVSLLQLQPVKLGLQGAVCVLEIILIF